MLTQQVLFVNAFAMFGPGWPTFAHHICRLFETRVPMLHTIIGYFWQRWHFTTLVICLVVSLNAKVFSVKQLINFIFT